MDDGGWDAVQTEGSECIPNPDVDLDPDVGWEQVESNLDLEFRDSEKNADAIKRPVVRRGRGRPRKQAAVVEPVHGPLQLVETQSQFYETVCTIGPLPARSLFLKFRRMIEKGFLNLNTSDLDPVASFSRVSMYLEQNRPLMSVQAQATNVESSRKTIPRDFQRISCSLILCANQFWGLFLGRVAKNLADHVWEAVAFVKVRRYDETPTRLRVQYLGASESATAKVYQSMFDLALVVFDTNSHKHLLLHGSVPCPLMCVDRGTAETAAHLQRKLERSVPDLERVSRLFPIKISVPTTDRAPAMLLAEKLLQRSDPSWIKCHMTCDVHRASQVQSAAMKLVSGHVSGLIAAALSMHLAGSKATLRNILYDIVEARLEIKIGEPPAWFASHRKRLHDLLLGEVTDGKRKSSPLTLCWRRRVLSFFLNGDLTDMKNVTFWSPLPINRAHFLQQFKRFAIPALLSSVCPTFPRSRWHGGHLAVSWAALLQSHHGLLTPLLQKWANQNISIPVRVPCSDAVDSKRQRHEDDQKGWDFQVPPSSNQQPSNFSGAHDHDGSNPFPTWYSPETTLEEQLPTLDTGDFDWAAWNRAQKKKASAWGATNNLDSTLLAMRLSMTGPMRMMFGFLQLAGEQWDTEQELKLRHGLPRTYRMVEACNQTQMNAFWKELDSCMLQEHREICQDGATRSLRALLFRMLSCCGCAAEQLLGLRRKGYPFALFRVLNEDPIGPNQAAAAVFADSPCLYDELTHRLVQQFNSPEKLASPTARAVLLALARQMHVDISQIEAQHAAVRRVSTLMSVQTHKSAFDAVNAQFIIRQQVVRRASFQKLRYGPVCKSTSRKNPMKKKKRRKGLGEHGEPMYVLDAVEKGESSAAMKWVRLLEIIVRSRGPQPS